MQFRLEFRNIVTNAWNKEWHIAVQGDLKSVLEGIEERIFLFGDNQYRITLNEGIIWESGHTVNMTTGQFAFKLGE